MTMWRGHSCPRLLTLILGIQTIRALCESNQYPKTKINFKSGGQECPPHTGCTYIVLILM